MTTAEVFSTPIVPAETVRFLGDEGVYWRLRIKGAALVVVTLGIYRFWLATDVRRYSVVEHRDCRRHAGI
jgi:uncharacterized membrane protein YjgN (DUF898 family)